MQNLCHMKAYEGSLFKDNLAEQQGGVVCAMELSDVLFNGSRAVNNSAPGGFGGVVALEARTATVLAGSTVMANNSAANGGAVGMTTDSNLRLEGACLLENNTATGVLDEALVACCPVGEVPVMVTVMSFRRGPS